jgi:ABC-type bacteriocin/lantibiotic exporter with double-glycine peptidase domain
VAATALLGLGGWLVISGELTLGQLVAAELIVMLVVGAFTKIGRHLETWYDLLAGIDKLGMLLDLPLESHGKLRLMPRGPARIELHKVSAAIDGQQSVKELSAVFPAGSSSSVLGPAGSGKTVLAELLCGLRPLESGFWEWNGIDARELRLETLREQIGVARNGEDVFSGTIEENIHLGRDKVSGVDIKNALRVTGLQDVVARMPEGSQTRLQTGGRPLTDSQVARLMLARALAGTPSLLLIDTTLDTLPDAEAKQIIESVRSEYHGTLILFTSRDALAKLCDKMVTLGKTA